MNKSLRLIVGGAAIAFMVGAAQAGNHHHRYYDNGYYGSNNQGQVSGFDEGSANGPANFSYSNLPPEVYSKFKADIERVDTMREDCMKKKSRMIQLKRSGANYTEIKSAVYDYKMAERDLGLAYRDLNMKIGNYYGH